MTNSTPDSQSWFEDIIVKYLDDLDVTYKMGEYYEEDVERLRHILTETDTEDCELIRIVCCRSNAERQLLKAEYNISYYPPLEKQIAKAFDGELRDLMLELFMTPSQYKAFCIKEALSPSRRYAEMIMIVIEILISSTPTEIEEIQEIYREAYDKCLHLNLRYRTKGYLQELFTFLLCIPRSLDEPFVNDAAAKIDADKFERSLSRKVYILDPKFIEIIFILSTRSFAHLLRVSEIFEESTKMDLNQFVEYNFFGLIQECLLKILQVAQSSDVFFACRLDEAFNVHNTGSKTLRRIIVSRGEVDLDEIMESYMYQYKEPLERYIYRNTSGLYKDLLTALIK